MTDIVKTESIELPYKCLAIDPPWPERGGGKSTRGAQRHYDLMNVGDISQLLCDTVSSRELDLLHKPPDIRVADDAHLWLWVTTNYLPDGLAIMKSIGFRYVRSMVWVKMSKYEVRKRSYVHGLLQVGLGQYLRGAHELCLFGVRGKAMVPEPENRLPDVIFAERTKHSRKPDEAFELFEKVSPGPRLEMFARNTRPGWDAFGNEVSDEIVAAG